MPGQQTPIQLLRHVESRFATYRESFSRGDRQAIASHFGPTVHVTTDTGASVQTAFFGTRDEWLAVIGELIEVYRRRGVVRGELRRLNVMPVSARLVQASARWAIIGRGDAPLYEFDALYTVANMEGTWRIVAIAHDEVSSQHSPTSRRAP